MKHKVTFSNGGTPSVCIIGTGFSGLCAAIQLKRQLELTSFTIFENNNDVGGVWCTNIYPNCGCDVPSHLYCYSFEPNPDWSAEFVSQNEILQYLKKVSKKYVLYPHIKFETEVKTLRWVGLLKKWKVTFIDKRIKTEENEFFDIIINGSGLLHQPKIPEEFKYFKGELIHSANWDSSIKLDNKIVGIVGSGASAIQIIPTLEKSVKELHIYQRNVPWVAPIKQKIFSKFTKLIFYYFPILMRLFRSYMFLSNELGHSKVLINSKQNHSGAKDILSYMRWETIGYENIRSKLIPTYIFGCARILKSNDYYRTLIQPKVILHRGKIVKVTNTGLESEDGATENLDVLILATGFQPQEYFAPMEIFGLESENILQAWKSKIGPQHFLGIVSTSMPNYFSLLGPNTSIGHNSVTFIMECQVNFTIEVLRELMRTNSNVLNVAKSKERNYMTWLRQQLKKTVWASPYCESWYQNKSRIVTTQWPGTCISYWNKTRNAKFNFEFN